MKILYGTTNKAKLQAMRTALKSFDIELIGLGDIDSELPSINENGKTPLENAEIKARTSLFQYGHVNCYGTFYFSNGATSKESGGISVGFFVC